MRVTTWTVKEKDGYLTTMFTLTLPLGVVTDVPARVVELKTGVKTS